MSSVDELDPTVEERFRLRCEQTAVSPADRIRLRALLGRWRGKASGPEARIDDLLADYGHFRLYVRSREGDAAAAMAFERHWRAFIRAFLGRRFNPDQVEDLCSLFFERVYRLIGADFHWSCPFSVYLQTLLVNLSRDLTRRLVVRRGREVSLESGELPLAARLQSPDPSPEAQVLEAERQSRVELALLVLSPVDRHIVRRCLLEEDSGQDLAADLGMSRDALYQRLSRAKRRLRRALVDGGIVSDR